MRIRMPFRWHSYYRYLSVLVLSGLVQPGLVLSAHAADTGGPIFRDTCTQITSPVTKKVLCWEQTTAILKYWDGAAWVSLTGSTAGVTSLNGLAGALAVLGTSGQIGVATASPNLTLALIDTAVTPGSYGSATQVGSFTVDAKGRLTAAANVAITAGVTSVSGTTDRITVSPTTGAAVVDIAATYVGQTSLTTLGTIGTGTWQGTSIATTFTDAKVVSVSCTTLTCSGTNPASFSIADGAIGNAKLANSSVTYNGVTVALGASGTLTLASSNFANQGTTTTVLHGNAAGNPSWGSVVSADLNITTTTCSNQFVRAITAAAGGTCSSIVTADLPASGVVAGTYPVALGSISVISVDITGRVTSASALAIFLDDWNGTLGVAKGGTNITSYTKGDLLVASAATTLTKLAVGTDGQVLLADSTQATGTKWGAAAAASLANPTASVGLTVVNGVATSAMRSDAAPPLDQGIIPTWTGAHIFKRSADSITAFQVQNSAGTTVLDADTTNKRVGIGTAAPSTDLHVVTAVNTIARIESTSASNYAFLSMKGTGREYQFGVGGASVGDVPNMFFLYDGTAGAYRMIMNTSGHVGIGPTTPVSAMLHVVSPGGGTYGAKLDCALNGNCLGLQNSASAKWQFYLDGSANVRLYDEAGAVDRFIFDLSGNLTIPNIKSTTGQRYVCVDTAGKLVSSATACVGT